MGVLGRVIIRANGVGIGRQKDGEIRCRTGVGNELEQGGLRLDIERDLTDAAQSTDCYGHGIGAPVRAREGFEALGAGMNAGATPSRGGGGKNKKKKGGRITPPKQR